MDKRSTRQVTLYSILFLVMLFFATITFFFGLKLGSEKTEEKYAHLLKVNTPIENYTYQQQDLVTFYITSYAPYKEFETAWFDSLNDISANRVSNPANEFDELASKAEKLAKEAANTSMKGLGLLENAQNSYIRSLNYFEKAAKDLKSSTNKKSSDETLTLITNDNNYKIAIEQALKAQEDYFKAMHLWTISMDPTIPSTFDSTITLPISTWDNYPLIVKVNMIASHFNTNKIYRNLSPQDVVSRIDEFVANNQAEQLKLTTVNEVLNLLLATDAIRQGDYQQYKGNRYDNEFLPKIPFFNAN